MRAQLVLNARNQHGEGVFWNPADGCVWWTDIEGRAIWSLDPARNESRSLPMADRVCCFAPCRSGGLIIAFDNRISLFDPETGREEKIHDYQPENPETRLNDGRVDRQGRLIVGGMNEKSGAATASVLRVDPDLSVTQLFDGVSCANSICFSPDGKTMYFADTPDREIAAYSYDPVGGTVSDRRVLASMAEEPGLPDGSCVDAEGGVWNAEWEGHRVVRVSPTGEIDRIIEVPVWKPTCCAFGGADLDTLYITTSRLLSDDEVLRNEPESGGLFAVKPGTRGVADVPFGR